MQIPHQLSKEQDQMHIVDQLGLLQAQIADLDAQAKELKNQLKARGDGAYEGDMFRATVSTSERDTLDMAAVRAKLSPQFITAHTSTSVVQVVKVVARNNRVINFGAAA